MQLENTDLELSIIIVNYNVKPFLEQCLLSVAIALRNIEAEVIVVDNASSDNSIVELKPLFPTVQFICSNQNLGFSKANNMGLTYAKGRFILFLNPDTIVSEDSLSSCLQYLNQQPNCGAVGVRMINGFGRFLPESKRAKPSLVNTSFKLMGLARLFPTSPFFNRYALGHLSSHKRHEVDILAGAFLMTRKLLLDELGGFDTSFFMYGEDIDLCIRIQKSGYKIQYLGDVEIIHYKGQSSRTLSHQQIRIFYKAMQIFVLKHYRLGALLIPLIWFSSMLVMFKKSILPSRSVLAMLKRTGTAFAICNSTGFQHIQQLLVSGGHSDSLIGMISVQENTIEQIGRLSDLTILCKEYQVKHLIIHVPEMSIKDSILLMERYNGLFFRFVFSDSTSLTFNS